MPAATDLPGFSIGETLHVGTSYSIHRATRLGDGAAVIVKVDDGPHADLQARARLEHEFQLTRGVDDAGIASAVAFERAGRHHALVFADTGQVSLDRYLAGRSLPLASFFRIAGQVADTLGRLHTRDIVHKDVKPANLLVDPQTLAARLTDFGIAAERARETAASRAPEELEGTLHYIAPEQTGRMNRSIDGRADLYALGVTFYEMLVRRLPFETEDRAELIHRHLTVLPKSPRELDPEIPEPLSRLVMKLLAKDPDERYQSATGLAHDLASLTELVAGGCVGDDFVLATRDVPDRLRLPERLYGRDDELAALVEAVDGVAIGRAQLVVIAGSSGVGKSSLVREVMRPVAGRRGHLISGKFDQLNRGTPYRAIGQAFAELVRKLLGDTAERVEQWRRDLLEAMGPSARVVLDVVPDLERLVGELPPVPVLAAAEAQQRFNLVFRRLMRALAGPRHPLVLFLDDLQWADGASLALIEVLMTDPDLSGLLVIGAYRDNEVYAGHPLDSLLSGLARERAPCRRIVLAPLDRASVTPLIADTVRVDVGEAAPLAALVTAKTLGNPFFVRQFLRTLEEKKLLVFDAAAARWTWDVGRIEQEQIADNVVELVTGRIAQLAPASQRLVRLAAAIGNHFDLETLALVSGDPPSETAAALAQPLAQEIFAPIGEGYRYARWSGTAPQADISYRFAHDRLQQAAYAMIPPEERPRLHAHIGALIHQRSTPAQREDRLFEIVGHLNLAATLPESRERRAELAELNLRAGQKARGSNAYEAALAHCAAGLGLVDAGSDPRLRHALGVSHIEAMYLCGRFEEAERLAHDLLGRTEQPLDKVAVLEQLVLAHTTRLQYRRAIDTALQALELLGEKIPGYPSQLHVMAELAGTKLALAGKRTEDLRRLPRMVDPRKLAAMRILMLATAPAYFENQNLLPILSLRMVRLSARYGNAAHSAYGYVMYGLVLCGVLNDMAGGLALGRFALEALDLFDAPQAIRGRVAMVFGGFILHWNGRLADTLPFFGEGAHASLEAGDLEFHGYNRYGHASYAFMSGMPLDKVSEILETGYQAVLQNKHEKTQRVFRMARQAVRELRGSAAAEAVPEAPFDEASEVAYWIERDRMALAYYYEFRLLKQFMARDYEGCIASARVIDENFNVVLGMAFSAWYLPYQSLALMALMPGMNAAERRAALRTIRRNQRRLRTWSRHAPHNYLHKHRLLEAERARLNGRVLDAEQAYDEAIRLANRHGVLPDAALAHELAGEFELARGRPTAGRAHLHEARQGYRHWGAMAWVDHLERRHAGIFGGGPDGSAASGAMTALYTSETKGMLDVAAITRAASAISGKILVDDVVAEVLEASVVNAGATRGLLVLARGSELVLLGEVTAGVRAEALGPRPFPGSGKGPERLINYVARTRENVVLDDATRDETYGADPFVVAHRPLSALCMPLLGRGELVGVLYVENALARGAFTANRIQTLGMLAAQAVISLENARLYQEIRAHADALELNVKERTRELEDAYGRLREIFGKYVPRRVAEAIVAGQGSLRPTETEATILYSDIQDFTGIVERLSPDRVVDMLNEYFPRVIEPIDRNGGIVNQFLGDAMLVTFNIPIADPQHADKAVRTAREIQNLVAGRTFAGIELVTRIGINTGNVIAGNVGSGERLNYAVYGDAVNLAARLEQLNKSYGTRILVSGTTVEKLGDTTGLVPVGDVVVRGKSVPVQIYRLD